MQEKSCLEIFQIALCSGCVFNCSMANGVQVGSNLQVAGPRSGRRPIMMDMRVFFMNEVIILMVNYVFDILRYIRHLSTINDGHSGRTDTMIFRFEDIHFTRIECF